MEQQYDYETGPPYGEQGQRRLEELIVFERHVDDGLAQRYYEVDFRSVGQIRFNLEKEGGQNGDDERRIAMAKLMAS